jgi:hypothetical protein
MMTAVVSGKVALNYVTASRRRLEGIVRWMLVNTTSYDPRQREVGEGGGGNC